MSINSGKDKHQSWKSRTAFRENVLIFWVKRAYLLDKSRTGFRENVLIFLVKRAYLLDKSRTAFRWKMRKEIINA